MRMITQLADFIAHARKKGMDHQTIRMLLLSAGWKEKDIAEALTEQALDMPVPMPSDTGGAREAFFHLLTFASLYATVIATVVLFFTYINRLFPDPALGEYYYQNSFDLSGIRWSLAAAIVSFPLFLWCSRFLQKEMRIHPERAWSAIRRWLTYLTLFVAAMALLGDGITLVFRLLEGELTIRFLLKVLIVLVVAGMTFAYYFLSLKTPVTDPKTLTLNRVFAGLSVIAVLIAIVWGIWLAGSPAGERLRKFDERRMEDLRAIEGEVLNIALGTTRYLPANERRVEKPIPATLEDVQANALYQKLNILDPETGDPYVYSVKGTNTFELCAVFNAARDERYDIFWNHEAGQKCFTFDVLDPSL